MRNYSKVGGKTGRPGYRTPSMFRNKVLKVVQQIPKGKTLTYKQVASMAGNEKACRAVGNIMNKNRDAKVFCHRVVKSDGSVGGFAFGTEKKIKKLESEGVIIIDGKVGK